MLRSVPTPFCVNLMISFPLVIARLNFCYTGRINLNEKWEKSDNRRVFHLCASSISFINRISTHFKSAPRTYRSSNWIVIILLHFQFLKEASKRNTKPLVISCFVPVCSSKCCLWCAQRCFQSYQMTQSLCRRNLKRLKK